MSHIPVANTPTWIDIPIRQLTNESKIHLKHGRSFGSKDVTPHKRITQEKIGTTEEVIKMIDQFKIEISIALKKGINNAESP